MQQMFFDEFGYPTLGYPVNPGIILESPAGEDGQPAGSIWVAEYGNAWGDAAEGSSTLGIVAGKWNISDRYEEYQKITKKGGGNRYPGIIL